MHKYLSKILIIVCLFSLISLNMLFVYAEPDENNTSEETVVENTTSNDSENNTTSSDETTTEDTTEDTETKPSDDDIHTETTTNQKVQPSSLDNMGITSVKNINGLPEANLELNNILNIILISIGVLLILLSIALLIRIGKK